MICEYWEEPYNEEVEVCPKCGDKVEMQDPLNDFEEVLSCKCGWREDEDTN